MKIKCKLRVKLNLPQKYLNYKEKKMSQKSFVNN